jgi:hypothetical protein
MMMDRGGFSSMPLMRQPFHHPQQQMMLPSRGLKHEGLGSVDEAASLEYAGGDSFKMNGGLLEES